MLIIQTFMIINFDNNISIHFRQLPASSWIIMLLLISLAFFYFRNAEAACVAMEEQKNGKQKSTTM